MPVNPIVAAVGLGLLAAVRSVRSEAWWAAWWVAWWAEFSAGDAFPVAELSFGLVGDWPGARLSLFERGMVSILRGGIPIDLAPCDARHQLCPSTIFLDKSFKGFGPRFIGGKSRLGVCQCSRSAWVRNNSPP